MAAAVVFASPLAADVTVEDAIVHLTDGAEHAARVHRPDPANALGVGVLLVGGGYGNTLDWTVPGTVEWPPLAEGGDPITVPMTTSGTDHHDALLLAEALGAAGFTVLHWDTTPSKPGTGPAARSGRDVLQGLLGQTRAAVETLRAVDGVGEAVLLCGHSMGGQRAAVIAAEDTRVIGLVLLCPAQVTRTGPGDRGFNLHAAAGAVAFDPVHDSSGDRGLDAGEWAAWLETEAADGHPAAAIAFETFDFDGDGVVRGWEISGRLAIDARRAIPEAERGAPDGAGIPFGEDSLAKRPVPTLMLMGALDESQGVHAPVVGELRRRGGPLAHVRLEVVPAVGHQLGAESPRPAEHGLPEPIFEAVPTLIGPIDAGVRDRVAAWSRRIADRWRAAAGD